MMISIQFKKGIAALMLLMSVFGCQQKSTTVASDISNTAGGSISKDISVSLDDIARMYYVLFTLQSDRYLGGAGNVTEIYKVLNRDDFVVQTTSCKIVYNFPSSQTNSMATHYDYDGPNNGRCPTDSADVPGLRDSISGKLNNIRKTWYIYQNLLKQRSLSLGLLDGGFMPAVLAGLSDVSGSMGGQQGQTVMEDKVQIGIPATSTDVPGDILFVDTSKVKDPVNDQVNPCKVKVSNLIQQRDGTGANAGIQSAFNLNNELAPTELAEQSRGCAAAAVPKSDVQASGAFGIH